MLNRLQKLATRVYPESQCDTEQEDLLSTCYFRCDSCKRNVETEEIIIHRLCRSDKGLSPGQQKMTLHTPREDWMSPNTAEYDYLIPQRRAWHILQYDGSSSKAFPICNGVKQGCVLVPTLFGYSSPCCLPMRSVHLQKVCAYIRELVTSCSTRPVCVRKPKYVLR